jgi:hypothetical protein
MRTEMLSLREAAALLGYSERGLRRIVDRSRQKSQGIRVAGPMIRFFQTAASAPIHFKQEWVEEFIAAHTIDPLARSTNEPQRSPKAPRQESQPFTGNLNELRSRHWLC